MKVCRKSASIFLALLLVVAPFGSSNAQTNPKEGAGGGTVVVPLEVISSGSDRNNQSFGASGPRDGLPVSRSPTTPQIPGIAGLVYQIHILGEVAEPATYRVPASTRLSEALTLAGGITGRGSLRFIELRRTGQPSQKVDLLSFTLLGNLDENPYLLDNDVIYVPLREKTIQVAGTIKRPGVYELRNERTLEDIVRLAGGFTPGLGRPAPIKVIRFAEGKKELIDVENKEDSRRGFRLQNADVIVVPHFLTQNKKFDYNLSMLPGDHQLFYPSYEERINVIGAVFKPGPYPFSPFYNDVQHYLTLAGGATRLAKRRRMRALSPEGKARRVSEKSFVNPGETIIIPERYMGPESVVSLVLGVTASILGITTTVLTLTR